MKKLLLLFGLIATLGASAQFTNTDTVRKRINADINNSPVYGFQQLRLNKILYSMANLIDSAAASGGGGGTPGGSETALQFHDAGGIFGGDAGATYNKTLNRITTDTLAAINSRLRLLEFPNSNTRTIRWHNINADTSVIGTRPYGEFNITQSEALVNEDGQRDVVQMIGYNNDGVGGRRNTNEAGLWLTLESHYIPFPGGQPQFEWFLQSVAKNGNVNRHFALDINKNTGASSGYFRSGGWTFFGDNTNDWYAGLGNGAIDINNYTPGGASFLRLYNDNGAGIFFIQSIPGHAILSTSGPAADMTVQTSRNLTLSNQVLFNTAADAYTGGNVTFDLPTANLNKAFAFRDQGQDAILTLRDSIGTTQHIVEINGRMRIAGMGNGTGNQDVLIDAYGNFITGTLAGEASGMSLINPIVEDSLLHVYDDTTLLVKAPIDGPGYTVESTDTTFQILLSGNFVTPYDYDAVNDSTVDNSAAFTALWSNVGIKPIYIPPGVWTIPNTRLTFPQRGGYVFGAGIGATVLRTNYINNTGGTPLSNIDGFLYGDTSMNNTTIRDFTIRHYGSSASKYVNQALIVAYMGANYDANPSGDHRIEHLNLFNLKFEAPDVSFHAIKLFAFRSGKGGYMRYVTGENLIGDRLGSNFLDLSSGGSGDHLETKWMSDINFRRVTASKLGLVGDYGFGATVEVCDRCILDGWHVDSAKNIAFEFIKTKNSALLNSTIKNSQPSTLAIAFNGFATHLGDENRVENVIVTDTNSLGIQIQNQNYFKMSNSSFTNKDLIKFSNVPNSSFTNNIYDYRGTSGHTVVSVEGGTKNSIWTGETVRGDSATAGTFSTGIAFNGATTTGNLWNGVNIRYGPGGGTPVSEAAGATGNQVVNYSVNGTRFNHSGTWSETARLQKIGVYYIWFDGSGRLRFKSSIPTSDTDGTVLVPIPAGGTTGQVLEKSSNTDYAFTWGTDDGGGGGSGTVTNVSGVNANGFTFSIANPTTTPAITLGTGLTGIIKGNGSAFVAAVAGTDYAAASHTHAQADITNLVTDLSNKQPLDAELNIVSALGTANQQIRVKADGTGLEYFTPAGGSESTTASNGLTLSGVDVRLGGTLTGATAINGAQTLNFGNTTALTSFNATAADISLTTTTSTITLDGGVKFGIQTGTDANNTINNFSSGITLPTITANRTLTLPATSQGRTVWIHNNNTSAFTWTFSGTVHDAYGNSVIQVPRGVMQLQHNGATSSWKVASIAAGNLELEYISSIQSDYTLSAASGVQSAFPSAQDAVLLEASTTYEMEGFYIINTGTTTHTTALAFALGGGAVVTSWEYEAETWSGAANAVTASNTATVWWTTHVSGVASKVINATNVQPWTIIKFKGLVRMNTGGTVTPQINFSANPTGTNLMKVGSYIRFTKKGSNTMTTFGPWN